MYWPEWHLKTCVKWHAMYFNGRQCCMTFCIMCCLWRMERRKFSVFFFFSFSCLAETRPAPCSLLIAWGDAKSIPIAAGTQPWRRCSCEYRQVRSAQHAQIDFVRRREVSAQVSCGGAEVRSITRKGKSVPHATKKGRSRREEELKKR